MKRALSLTSILLLLAAAPAAAEIYTWVDENGVTGFSSEPQEQTEPEAGRRSSAAGLWDGSVLAPAVAEPGAPARIADDRR